jgi:hypothetical protein
MAFYAPVSREHENTLHLRGRSSRRREAGEETMPSARPDARGVC